MRVGEAEGRATYASSLGIEVSFGRSSGFPLNMSGMKTCNPVEASRSAPKPRTEGFQSCKHS